MAYFPYKNFTYPSLQTLSSTQQFSSHGAFIEITNHNCKWYIITVNRTHTNKSRGKEGIQHTIFHSTPFVHHTIKLMAFYTQAWYNKILLLDGKEKFICVGTRKYKMERINCVLLQCVWHQLIAVVLPSLNSTKYDYIAMWLSPTMPLLCCNFLFLDLITCHRLHRVAW